MKESDLIYGIMASFSKPEYSITQLKYLLAPFSVNESCIRTNLSRMKRKKLVSSRSRGKKAFYRISDKGTKIGRNVAHSFKRLDWKNWDKSFWGVVFSVPETKKAERHNIRKNLLAYRFAMFSKGFWIRPYHEQEKFIKNIFLHKHCHLSKFYNVKDLPAAVISRLWDLKAVNQSFLKALRLLDNKNKELKDYSPAQALIEKMLVGEHMIHAIFKDPLLPDMYLPDNWKADQLRKEFFNWDKAATAASRPYWEKVFKEEEIV
jgi:phenylacetic acid degradation operon negative regulatory protein